MDETNNISSNISNTKVDATNIFVKKDYSISILRLFATILIFFSHTLTFGFGTYICDNYFPFYFGVNIFLSISAILFSNKEIKKGFFKKQFTKILTPVIIYICFIITIQLITKSFEIAVFGNLWYIIEILICYMLLPLLNNIKNGIHKKTSVLIVSLVVIGELILSIFTVIQVGIICYVLAYFMAKLLKDKSYSLCIFFVITFVLACLTYYFVPVVTIKHWICCVMGICFTFAFLNFCSIKINKPIKILDITDKYSYCFYITQQCLMLGSLSIINITKYFSLNVLIIFVINLLVCFLLNKVSSYVINLINKKH